MSNTDIWDALGKTDPSATKPFNRAGGFKGTATKPMWILRRLTEQFGPAGEGWGVNEPKFEQVHSQEGEVLVYCTVSAWHGKRENVLWGVGGDKAVTKRNDGKVFHDDEAYKKAFTDAINNAFKSIGVGADIHMGLFDDNKYVAAMEREFAEDDRSARGRNNGPTKTALDTAENQIVRELSACADEDMLVAYLETEEYKAGKALLEEFRPSALFGPPPADCPEYVHIKKRIANMLAEFRDPAREQSPFEAE